MGEAILHTEPSSKLSPILLKEQGKVDMIKGVSVSTFLKDRNVSERQAKAAERNLNRRGYKSNIEVVYDESNQLQKGSSISIWTETDKDVIIGGDAIGEIGKQSETVGSEAAESLLAELDGKVTMDIHMADMIIPYVSLVPQSSYFVARKISDHLQTNIWLTEKILGTTFNMVQKGSIHMIQKK
jgi:RNA 3'-terminal phosphate cyclase (ATP)